MTILNPTLNPISPQERVKINQNWDMISARFSNLQSQIQILAGGADVQSIIDRIEMTITDARTATANTQAALAELSQALSDLQTIMTNANMLNENLQIALDAFNLELSNMRFTGLYSPTVTYRKNNFARLNKSTYVALKTNLNIIPSDDGVNWNLVAAGGVDGNGTVNTVNGVGPSEDGNVTLDVPTREMLEAIDRKVDDNLSTSITNVFNIVYGFGADRSGLTDSTLAIQNAIDAAEAAGGGVVIIPGGVYSVSNIIRLKSRVSLIGSGRAIVRIVDNATLPYSLFVYEGVAAEDIKMKGFTIDGNRQNNVDHGVPDSNGNQSQYWPGTLLALINITNASNVNIKNMKILNSWGNGMWLNDCRDSTVDNNQIRDYRITAIAIRNNTSIDGVSEKVVINNNKCSGGVIGIHSIFGNDFITLSNNNCSNNRDSNRFPSYAYGGTYPNVFPLTGGFKSNSDIGYVSPSFQGDGAGIEFTGLFTSEVARRNTLSTIVGNICDNNMIGVRLEEETRNITVSGNVCSNNEKHGIFVFSSSYNQISANICSFNGFNGIQIEKLTGRISPELNSLVGNTCTGNQQFGINLLGARRNIISNNNVSDNNLNVDLIGGGVGLYYVDSTASSRNIISGNNAVSYNGRDKYGIYSASELNDGNKVSGNIFEGQTVASLNLLTSINSITNNTGYRTSAIGQAFVGSGVTSVDVIHGLPFAPFNGEIQVTPVSQFNGSFWVNGIDANKFTINISAAATELVYFNWCISDGR